MNSQPDTFWAWLAGFIDGDGTVGIYRDSQGYIVPKIVISQKDRGILDGIVTAVGTGSVHVIPNSWGGAHQLAFGSGASKRIARQIAPYLKVPKKKTTADAMAAIVDKQRTDAVHERPEFKQAVAFYKSGLSCKTIGEKIGVKAATVNSWLRSRGMTRTYQEAQQLRRKREAV